MRQVTRLTTGTSAQPRLSARAWIGVLLVLLNLGSAALMSAGPLTATGASICAGHHHAGAPDGTPQPAGDCCSGCCIFSCCTGIAPCPQAEPAMRSSRWTAIAFHQDDQTFTAPAFFIGHGARAPPAFA